MPTIRQRLQRAFRAFRGGTDFKSVSESIDKMIALKQLETGDIAKESNNVSKLSIRDTKEDNMMFTPYQALRYWVNGVNKNKLPPYGSIDRDFFLSSCWQDEPILAGAIYSMTAKMTALRWTITGRRLVARNAAHIFAQAAHINGYDWGGFISSTAEDFYTTDRGVFWETARVPTGYGKDITRLIGGLAEVGHIDSLACYPTGNTEYPVVYYSDVTGQKLLFQPGEFVHFASLQSSRESNFGIGFCAVSRAYKAAKLLMGLHDYDWEKLNNLPPEGVAAVTGMTIDEFQDAIALWLLKRKQDESLTFPQVLWLIGSNPGAEVSVDFQGFSQIPESFDRNDVVSQYVNTLALCFGVDGREFWPISSGALGTASESEIQHLKAKGKGPGEFISIVERHLNAELPDDAEFAFDTQDINEDMIAATVAKAWVDVFFPLYTGIPNPNLSVPNQLGGSGMPTIPGDKAGQQKGEAAGTRPPQPKKPALLKEDGTPVDNPDAGQKQTEQVITKDQFMRLLADKGVLPDYLLDDQRLTISDNQVHISKEGDLNEYTMISWEKGVLKEERLPPIVINSPNPQAPVADVVKSESVVEPEENYNDAFHWLAIKEQQILSQKRDIKGQPIKAEEASRGSSVTSKTLRDELARWRAHPILSKYALTLEEEAALLKANPRAQKEMIISKTKLEPITQ